MTPDVPGCQRLAAPLSLEVWRIDLNAAWPAEANQDLSDEEQARAQRFVFERHQHRYRTAHVALRHLLARRRGTTAAALRYVRGPHGKPALAPPHAGLRFNFSDSEALGLLAMSAHGEIGVDVEVLRPVPDALELAEIHFTATERRALSEASEGGERDRCFLVGWTRKEACLKAIGSGLSIAANTFEAGLYETTRRVSIPVGAALACVEVDSLSAGDDCVAALARCVDGGPA